LANRTKAFFSLAPPRPVVALEVEKDPAGRAFEPDFLGNRSP